VQRPVDQRGEGEVARRAQLHGATNISLVDMLPGDMLRVPCSLRPVSDLRSTPAPPVGAADRVRGEEAWPLVVVYADFTCPRCALAHVRLRGAPLRVAFRHFAIAAKHPRAVPLACAAEAAGAQGRFWELHDRLFGDPAHTGDPHLWNHARELGLDLDRFERDRRSEEAAAAVRAQTRGGMRAGIAVTPTLIAGGDLHPGAPTPELIGLLTG
jgi:protein-disulfide isomerase